MGYKVTPLPETELLALLVVCVCVCVCLALCLAKLSAQSRSTSLIFGSFVCVQSCARTKYTTKYAAGCAGEFSGDSATIMLIKARIFD